MFLVNYGWTLLLMATCIRAEMWKSPTAVDIQTSLEACQISNLWFLDVREYNRSKEYSSAGNSDVRCFTRKLGLWSDDAGFKAKRFVELLRKYQESREIQVVIDYCNDRHKQFDLDKWANGAFNCFARGSMGPQINEYVKNVYQKKLKQK